MSDPDGEGIEEAPTQSTKAKVSPGALQSEGIHPDVGAAPSLPVPPGVDADCADRGALRKGRRAGPTHAWAGLGCIFRGTPELVLLIAASTNLYPSKAS